MLSIHIMTRVRGTGSPSPMVHNAKSVRQLQAKGIIRKKNITFREYYFPVPETPWVAVPGNGYAME